MHPTKFQPYSMYGSEVMSEHSKQLMLIQIGENVKTLLSGNSKFYYHLSDSSVYMPPMGYIPKQDCRILADGEVMTDL